MTTYFVASGGSNTAPYDTWAKAATTFATGLANAVVNGDIVVLQYDGVPSGDAELSADTTYTVAANITIICSTNSGTNTITPTAMGTGNWIGNSTTNRSVTIGGGVTCYIYGLTLRTAGSTADSINIAASDADTTLDNCYLWQGNSATTSQIALGSTTANTNGMVRLINTTLRFGSTSQGLLIGNRVVIEGGSVSSSGSTPTTLVKGTGLNCNITFHGCDLSLITGTLVADQTNGFKRFEFAQCKLGSGVTILASQTTVPNAGGCEAWVFDSDSGDNHYQFGYYNALGSLTTDTSIYANDGAAYNTTPNRHSWKIVTTGNASFASPFITPWITVHHEGTSAITPNLECVRSGSATAFKDNEVWSEWMFKGTSGFPLATVNRSDRMAVAGSSANQTTGALGAGDWTGENATAWFGKLAPSASFTPAELGDLCARVGVGVASDTVYVDPQIRGRS